MTENIKSVNLDSKQTAFFARELEYVKARSYDVQYPELKATSLIPVSTEAGPGAESITYQQFDRLGVAKIISNYADDLPRADIKGAEFTSPIRSIGASYGYNVQEIRAAQFAGRSLEQRRANSARRAVEEQINKIGFYGNDENGLKGLLTHPNITRVAVDENAGQTSTKFADKTPQEILDDLNNLVDGIIDLTNGIEMPNTLLMPIKQYRIIANTRLADGTDTTILNFFLQNSPFIQQVEWVQELKGSGLGAGSLSEGEDVMIAYDNNVDKLSLEIPQPFEQFPVQEDGLNFKVPCHARIGGVVVYYPLSLALAEGI